MVTMTTALLRLPGYQGMGIIEDLGHFVPRNQQESRIQGEP